MVAVDTWIVLAPLPNTERILPDTTRIRFCTASAPKLTVVSSRCMKASLPMT
jgi:cytochrome c oxidase assembly factor CtaG